MILGDSFACHLAPPIRIILRSGDKKAVGVAGIFGAIHLIIEKALDRSHKMRHVLAAVTIGQLLHLDVFIRIHQMEFTGQVTDTILSVISDGTLTGTLAALGGDKHDTISAFGSINGS